MGAELGATTSIFPADAQTRRFLTVAGAGAGFPALAAQGRPGYAGLQEVDLESVDAPHQPSPVPRIEVAPVKDLEGTPVEQVLIGSCANSSFRDLMIAARALQGRRVHPRVSLEINPGSRQVLENLILAGGLVPLLGGRGPGDAAGLLGLHRHGPGPAHQCGVGAHLSPEFSGAQRHQRR